MAKFIRWQSVGPPLKCLITGCAGFIGSHTAERFLAEGWEVVGIDNFDPYYAREIKEANLEGLRGQGRFTFLEEDLGQADLRPVLKEADSVLHLAAQAGVRSSWGEGFGRYLRNNVLCTQRLLEQCVGLPLRNFVYAGSSSVYGVPRALPVDETNPTIPISPYGMTKLYAEQVCEGYRERYHIPVVRLRYFSVYGPRQRPDMLMNKMIRAGLAGGPLDIYGDGTQTRDFTYVEDVANANWLAASKGEIRGVLNIASGRPVSVNEVIRLVEELSGKKLDFRYRPKEGGDPPHTHAATSRAREILGYEPKTSLREGLAKQIEWQRAHLFFPARDS